MMEQAKQCRKIYFAGDLFDHKDLTGNLLLAHAMTQAGDGRYEIVLPQASEGNMSRATDIRDGDYEMLTECDCIVCNFDGTDLDSGTVAEFCFAKFLDMPCVLLRTDFRFCGDRSTCPDPWNLMCSNFPRTRTVALHGMTELHQCEQRLANQSLSLEERIAVYHGEIAHKVIDALDQMCEAPDVLGLDFAALLQHYQRGMLLLGGKMAQIFPEERLHRILKRKIANKIYR